MIVLLTQKTTKYGSVYISYTDHGELLYHEIIDLTTEESIPEDEFNSSEFISNSKTESEYLSSNGVTFAHDMASNKDINLVIRTTFQKWCKDIDLKGKADSSVRWVIMDDPYDDMCRIYIKNSGVESTVSTTLRLLNSNCSAHEKMVKQLNYVIFRSALTSDVDSLLRDAIEYRYNDLVSTIYASSIIKILNMKHYVAEKNPNIIVTGGIYKPLETGDNSMFPELFVFIDCIPTDSGTYVIYMHEIGVDELKHLEVQADALLAKKFDRVSATDAILLSRSTITKKRTKR